VDAEGTTTGEVHRCVGGMDGSSINRDPSGINLVRNGVKYISRNFVICADPPLMLPVMNSSK
jgi:hypothetical protein